MIGLRQIAREIQKRLRGIVKRACYLVLDNMSFHPAKIFEIAEWVIADGGKRG